MRLQSIDFGRDTAEFDIRLKDYFIQTPAYRAVKGGRKSIIVGRKGTGKTAIAKYCLEDENPSCENTIVIEATHTTYTRIEEGLRRYKSNTQNLDTTFCVGWLITSLFALLNRIQADNTVSLLSDEKRTLIYAQSQLGYRHEDPFAGLAGYLLNWITRLQSVGSLKRDTTPQERALDDSELLPMMSACV